MHDELSLERWADFCLSVSAAAATLIGLLFVAITLAAERRPNETEKIRLYLTPPVVFFATVLLLATILTFPNHSSLTVTICSCAFGSLGLLYSGSPLLRRDKVTAQYKNPFDIILYVVMPAIAYATLIAGGAVVQQQPQRGLMIIAGAMVALLTLAIRNSWAIAVYVVSSSGGSG